MEKNIKLLLVFPSNSNSIKDYKVSLNFQIKKGINEETLNEINNLKEYLKKIMTFYNFSIEGYFDSDILVRYLIDYETYKDFLKIENYWLKSADEIIKEIELKKATKKYNL